MDNLNIDAIGFDADDTLWENEHLYQDAKQKFKRLISRYNDPEIVARGLDEIEVANLQVYGYGIKSFVLSMVEAALQLSGGKVEAKELQELLAIAHEMLAAEMRLLPQAREVVTRLAESHTLLLITKGDLFEQAHKVARSGLAEYFKYVEVLVDKTPESYLELLERRHVTPTRFLMVGNSLRSDIFPVLAIGGKAVYIPQANTWAHESADPEAQEANYYEIKELGELLGLVMA